MTTTLPDLPDAYGATINPIRGGRRDVRVTSPAPVQSFDATDIVAVFRRFFDQLVTEAEARKGDPVAETHALALIEALLADVRYARDTVRKLSADALHEHKVRRLTIESVITVEASSTADRSDWEHHKLMVALLEASGLADLIDGNTGEKMPADSIAATVLAWLRPEWRLTPIRDVGLDPDDYSTLAKGEDGKPLRTPTVTIKDNLARRVTAHTHTTTQETS